MHQILFILLMFIANDVLAQNNIDWLHDKQRKKSKEKVFTPRINIKTELVIKAPEEEKNLACKAEVSLLYSQIDTIIEVESEITNEDCGASYGKYKLRIKTRSEASETTTTTHNETWSREDSNTVKLLKEYDMNGDVDLVSVRVHASFEGLCTCKEEE